MHASSCSHIIPGGWKRKRVKYYIFEFLLSAVGQIMESSSDMNWPSLSKIFSPLSKEGTGACIASCKREFLRTKTERNKQLLTKKQFYFCSPTHFFIPCGQKVKEIHSK